MQLNCLVYDIEVAKAIEPNLVKRIPGIVYAENGWDDKGDLGVACICAWDMLTERPLVYFKEDLKEFAELVSQRELLVGFNHQRFDNIVLLENGVDVTKGKQYDVLLEGWIAAGLSIEKFTTAHRGFGLEDFSQANLKTGKTGNGALAPVWWQQGKISKVLNYCAADVQLTLSLFKRIFYDNGQLIHPQNQLQLLKFRKPFDKPEVEDGVPITDKRQVIAYDRGSNRAVVAPRLSDLPPNLVPEIQQPLFEGVPEKVVGYHKEVKPEGAPKSDDDANR